MADFKVKVDTSVLQTTAAEVINLTRALQNDFDELQNCVRQTSRYWVGAAGDQYRREFDAEKKETSELLTLLGKYPTDLLSMAGVYGDVERVNTQRKPLSTMYIWIWICSVKSRSLSVPIPS